MARKRSAGISLLEVLFSIGVVAIGLLGVISVVPVALDQVRRGNTAERSSRLGLNAVMEFNSRNMNVASNWVMRDRSLNNTSQLLGGKIVLANKIWTPPLPATPFPLHRNAFCIDPQFVSANLSVSLPASSVLDPDVFPYYKSTHLRHARMLRISLFGAINPGGGSPFPEVLRRPIADSIFSLQDELAFNVSKDVSLPPTQIYHTNARRESTGGFSWIATLVPREYPSNFDTDFTNDVANPFAYVLSIVVFNRRDARLAMFDDQNANNFEDAGEPLSHNESIAIIYDKDFYDGGIRGGEVLVDAASAEAIDVRPGDWALLARSFPYIAATDTTTFPRVQHFRWYRITGTDAAPEPGGTLGWTRQITIQGPDWAVVNPPPAAASPQPLPTDVVFVRHVATVHERSILVTP